MNNLKRLFVLLLLALASPQLYGQEELVVKGKVTAADGDALIGVSVSVSGTDRSVSTGIDGTFSISGVPANGILVFRYLGYSTKEVPVENRRNIDVVLEESLESLEEVVVIGYGEQKKINLTGAVDNVNLSDVQDRVFTDASQILQGKSAGVMITQNSGQPGQDQAEVRIRGISSIDNNNDPLVIIDGVQASLSDVNPNDIESVSILKDAAAASIYGNRAAGGVLIITTKKGTDALTINYIGTGTMQQPSRIPRSPEAPEYARLHNEGRLNSRLPPTFTEEQIRRYEEAASPEYQSTNWYDRYFSNAYAQNHYLSVKGGLRGRYNFSLSGGYLDQSGVLIGTGHSKFNYLANVNAFFLKGKLQVGAQLLGYDSQEGELYNSSTSVLQTVGATRPVAFFQSSEGLYSLPAAYIGAHHLGGGITRERNNMKYQFRAQYKLIKSLTWTALYANQRNAMDYSRFSPNMYTAGNALDGDGTFRPSELNIQNQHGRLITFNTTLRYDQKVGTAHEFNVLAGFEAIEHLVGGFGASGRNLSANLPIITLADPATITPIPVTNAERASLSLFGRFNYNYRSKYLFEANIRRDGSSRFFPGNQWGTFPSVSAGWVISEEGFMDGQTWLDLLKVRGSWGKLGNEGIHSYYAASDVLSAGVDYNFGGTVVPGTATSLLANRNTTWETTRQTNLGLDLTVLKKVTLTANYFDKKTTNILARVTIPGSLGVSGTPYQNVGSMSNRGVEVALEYRSNPSKPFQYTINANMTHQRNEVVDLGPLPYIFHTEISGYAPPAGVIRSIVGHPFGSYYGLVAEGIYQMSDFVWQNDSDPSIDFYDREFQLKPDLADPSAVMPNPMPGDIKFKDNTQDGFIDDDDKQVIGNSLPRYLYALNIGAKYKGFDISVLAQGALDAEAYLMGAMVTPFWGGTGNISREMADNRWTPENPSNSWQRLYDDRTRNNIISSYYIQNASYLRLKNIMLGYSFQPRALDAIRVRSLRVFLTMENVVTVAAFSRGFDPERSFNRITSDFHPQIRTFSLGLNLGL